MTVMTSMSVLTGSSRPSARVSPNVVDPTRVGLDRFADDDTAWTDEHCGTTALAAIGSFPVTARKPHSGPGTSTGVLT